MERCKYEQIYTFSCVLPRPIKNSLFSL
uniref:Uncharacterized protein n=1 Tax=Rhizophora mucronata TaxID=61149 RepID=A0A2P2PZU1_RHIMU